MLVFILINSYKALKSFINVVFICSLVARDKGSKLFLKVGRISILPLISSYKLFSRLLLLFRGIVPRAASFSLIYKVFASWFLVGTGARAFVSIASAIAFMLVVALVYKVSISPVLY